MTAQNHTIIKGTYGYWLTVIPGADPICFDTLKDAKKYSCYIKNNTVKKGNYLSFN